MEGAKKVMPQIEAQSYTFSKPEPTYLPSTQEYPRPPNNGQYLEAARDFFNSRPYSSGRLRGKRICGMRGTTVAEILLLVVVAVVVLVLRLTGNIRR
jgi:hypothetical protein